MNTVDEHRQVGISKNRKNKRLVLSPARFPELHRRKCCFLVKSTMGENPNCTLLFTLSYLKIRKHTWFIFR